MRLAIVVPTIEGREQDLRRCLDAYRETAPKAKVYVEFGHPSCGAAWIAGAEKAERDGFDYLHFTADDLEPHPGWLDIAVDTVNRGYIPAPLVFHPNGELESAGLKGLGVYVGPYDDWMYQDGTTVPFITAAMWDRIGMIDVHYCTDLYVSHRGRMFGWQTVIRTGMCFTHYTAQPGRNYGRVSDDTNVFLRAVE